MTPFHHAESFRFAYLACVALAACASPGAIQQPSPSAAAAMAPARAAGYDLPAPPILRVLHAPSPPHPSVSPEGSSVLLVSWVEYPPIAQVAEPFLRLAGLRVEPRTRRKHDTRAGYGINPCVQELTLLTVATGAERKLQLPAGCVDSMTWSADGSRIAFLRTDASGVEPWVYEVAKGEARRVAGVRLNPMLGIDTLLWMPDQKTLLVKLVPDGQGPAPVAEPASEAPGIQETIGQKGESSTYEARDTLSSKYDEALFEHYASAQLARIDVESGAVTRLGPAGILADIDVSPDGKNLLVQTIHRPFSYVTAFDRFPREVEVWDPDGKRVQKVASLPLADRVPVHGVPTGPRHFFWRATAPATLVWAEALDGGDWKATVPARDKLMLQAAPFTSPPVEWLRTEQRFASIAFGRPAAGKPAVALLFERDDNRHWSRTFTFDPDAAAPARKVLFDHSYDEKYQHPGYPVMTTLPNGAHVLRQSGSGIFLRGAGASPGGDRPFLDRLDLESRANTRLFRSGKTEHEAFLDFAGPAEDRLLTWHQSLTDPPNLFVRSRGAPLADAPAGEPAVASTAQALSHLPDPNPEIRAIRKRLVTYRRKDGLDLSFTLYTPPGWTEGTRVPAVLYAYPRDYAEAKVAGQVTGSQYTFTRLANYRLLLLAGYAIIDNASFPIIGDPKHAYDTYLEQLVADAEAAVDKAVELGVVDRERIGVTGHSHGALMTVNLLAHSNLFRAGVATSGAYNKTLTPFGFQRERRSVWEAQSVYLKASPFFSADKLKLPLLLMHGADDANPGTTPLQSAKLFEAVRGNGGTVRLVTLPHEPHSYRAMESNEQFIYEMIRWFDLYVKGAGQAQTAQGSQ
jgi:dipeptidyl aminopeptidase/acylaminoacyl peptidase